MNILINQEADLLCNDQLRQKLTDVRFDCLGRRSSLMTVLKTLETQLSYAFSSLK